MSTAGSPKRSMAAANIVRGWVSRDVSAERRESYVAAWWDSRATALTCMGEFADPGTEVHQFSYKKLSPFAFRNALTEWSVMDASIVGLTILLR